MNLHEDQLGRIIVRNLPFQATEEKIRKFFQLEESLQVLLLQKKKRFMGVAFIQLPNLRAALKLIKHYNKTEFMRRIVVLDMAVEKNTFKLKVSQPEKANLDHTKTEGGSSKSDENNLEEMSDKLDSDDKTQIEEDSDDETQIEEDSDDETQIEEDSDDETQIEEDSDSNMGDNENIKPLNVDRKKSEPKTEERHSDSNKTFRKGPSQDVKDGRTLFVKDIGLDATKKELQTLFEEFGKVKKVLFCLDFQSKKFKGVAFVEYENCTDAEACLEAFSDPMYKSSFVLNFRSFKVMRAVSRQDISKRKEETGIKFEPKDKRNIYLAREGVIREGTMAAKGLSQHDLRLRTEREFVKRRLLKNLHMFVSPTRLFVQNIPTKVTDKMLRNIFVKHSPKDAKIIEVRIMTELYNLDNAGKSVSRGFGFVNFSDSQHALATLRQVNNNPQIFSNNKRPIVEFALENRAALNAREKRLEKSKEKNKRRFDKVETETEDDGGNKVEAKKFKATKNLSDFVGSQAKKGISLSTHVGPKIRHKKRTGGEGAKKKKKKADESQFSTKELKQSGQNTITRNKINNQFRKTRQGRNDMVNKKQKKANNKKGHKKNKGLKKRKH